MARPGIPGRSARRGCAGSPRPDCPVPSAVPARVWPAPCEAVPECGAGRQSTAADRAGRPAAAGPARPESPGQPSTAEASWPGAGAREAEGVHHGPGGAGQPLGQRTGVRAAGRDAGGRRLAPDAGEETTRCALGALHRPGRPVEIILLAGQDGSGGGLRLRGAVGGANAAGDGLQHVLAGASPAGAGRRRR